MWHWVASPLIPMVPVARQGTSQHDTSLVEPHRNKATSQHDTDGYCGPTRHLSCCDVSLMLRCFIHVAMFCACPSSSWHPSLIWSAFEKKVTMSMSQLWGGANRESETLKITEIQHHGYCHLKKKNDSKWWNG